MAYLKSVMMMLALSMVTGYPVGGTAAERPKRELPPNTGSGRVFTVTWDDAGTDRVLLTLIAVKAGEVTLEGADVSCKASGQTTTICVCRSNTLASLGYPTITDGKLSLGVADQQSSVSTCTQTEIHSYVDAGTANGWRSLGKSTKVIEAISDTATLDGAVAVVFPDLEGETDYVMLYRPGQPLDWFAAAAADASPVLPIPFCTSITGDVCTPAEAKGIQIYGCADYDKGCSLTGLTSEMNHMIEDAKSN